MDLPGNPADLLREDLSNLRLLNRTLGGYRGVLWGLKCFLDRKEPSRFSLLDIGTGSGDIPIAIVRWAKAREISARVVAMEADPVTAGMARRLTRDFPEISIVLGNALHPPFAPRSFDFVLSSQLLHHFSEAEIVSLLRIWSRLAGRALLVSDLIRHPVAYHGIRLLTLIFTRNQMTRTDGPLSVRRAFTLAEWRELFCQADVGEFRLYPVFPFRLLALFPARG